MSHRRCCCCEDETIITPTATHRNLTTGDPHPTDNMLDAIEILWQCFNGDMTGLTQETVAQNCTVGTAELITRSGGVRTLVSGQWENQVPGCVQAKLHDIVPTAGKNFAVAQIVWTGQRFDAFSHKAHIAEGFLKLYGGEAQGAPLNDGADHHVGGVNGIAPSVHCGIAIRSGGLLFLYTFAPTLENTLNGPVPFGGTRDNCYDDLAANPALGVQVLEDGLLRSPTTTELRTNGLTVDPIATQMDHEVGFFVAFAPTTDSYSGDLLSSYDVTWRFDSLTIAAEYRLNCEVAFVDLNSLILSTPNPIGTSNIEPDEFRNVSTTLTLATLPGSTGNAVDDLFVARHLAEGYAYKGSFTPTGMSGVTAEVWYLPCKILSIKLSDGTHCPLWLSIDHADDYSADPGDGGGDDGQGNSTAPAFGGWAVRDVAFPPPANNNWKLGVTWYGSDCHDAGSHPPTGLVIDGVLGKCVGTGVSVCTQGNLPNQLTWMTNCYSLDPVAIGYRRRLTDQYAFGGTSCDLVDFTLPVGGEEDCDLHTSLSRRCNVTHLGVLGFSVGGGGSQLIEQLLGVTSAIHLYFDISEP